MDREKYIKGYHVGKCDKCGKKVPKRNSARLVAEVARGRSAGLVLDRHLYPTGGCEGSPSRVQLVKTDADWATAYALVKSVA